MLMMANKYDNTNNPFAEYLWMGEMEKFDEEVEAEFEEAFKEEEFIKSCIEQLLEEEEERETVYYRPSVGRNGDSNYHNGNQLVPLPNSIDSLTQNMDSLYVDKNKTCAPKTNGNHVTNNAPVKVCLIYVLIYIPFFMFTFSRLTFSQNLIQFRYILLLVVM